MHKKERLEGLARNTITDDDDDTVASSVTLDSWLSIMENDFSGMKDMLSKIFEKVNTGSEVTQPPIIQDAGITGVPPATGV